MVNGGGSDRYWTDTEVYRSKRGAQALSEAFGAALGGRGVSVNLQSPVVGADVSGRKVELQIKREFRLFSGKRTGLCPAPPGFNALMPSR